MRTLKGADAPILQMRRRGTAVLGPTEAIERARAEYERHRCLRLPQLLEPELWQFLQRELSQAQFEEQTYERIGSELSMVPGTVDFLLNLLSNDTGFLELIRQITGCDAIRSFLGRVYRLMPGQGHETNWHNDLTGTRLVAMSVNLSPEVYRGGRLQLRDPRSHRMLQEVANTGPGDAILFRIASDLQHRVTPVNGAVPKSAYAGWFQSESVTRSPSGDAGNAALGEPRSRAEGRGVGLDQLRFKGLPRWTNFPKPRTAGRLAPLGAQAVRADATLPGRPDPGSRGDPMCAGREHSTDEW